MDNLGVIFRSVTRQSDLRFRTISSASQAIKDKTLTNNSLCIVYDEVTRQIVYCQSFLLSSKNWSLLNQLDRLRKVEPGQLLQIAREPFHLYYTGLELRYHTANLKKFYDRLSEVVRFDLGSVEVTACMTSSYGSSKQLSAHYDKEDPSDFEKFICQLNLGELGDKVKFSTMESNKYRSMCRSIVTVTKDCIFPYYRSPSVLNTIVALVNNELLINFEDFPPRLVADITHKLNTMLLEQFGVRLYTGEDLYFTTWFDVHKCVRHYQGFNGVKWYLDFKSGAL